MPSRLIPPSLPVPARLAAFDEAVDQWFDNNLRGRPIADRVMYTASEVGDHGLLWLFLGLVQAGRWRDDPEWSRRLLRTAIGLGMESALVNGPVKMVFRRTRPVHEGPRPHRLRRPRSSSFPSGHASAAFFGAALLRDGDALWPLYYAAAVVVASSRVHVKIHHGSDVVAGALTGALLGELARRLVPIGATAVRRHAESWSTYNG